MYEIVEFIEARLDEDELLAELADRRGRHEDPEEPAAAWSYRPGPGLGDILSTNGEGFVIDDIWPEFGLHIVRHSPMRILADVTAKRYLLEWYEVSGGPESDPQVRVLANKAIKAMAEIWADHPDYKDEWRWKPAVSGR